MISRESWYREADDSALTRLFQEYTRSPSAETARPLVSLWMRSRPAEIDPWKDVLKELPQGELEKIPEDVLNEVVPEVRYRIVAEAHGPGSIMSLFYLRLKPNSPHAALEVIPVEAGLTHYRNLRADLFRKALSDVADADPSFVRDLWHRSPSFVVLYQDDWGYGDTFWDPVEEANGPEPWQIRVALEIDEGKEHI